MNKKCSKGAIVNAIRKVKGHKAFWRILVEESEAQSGPFDGGCLICAKAIIRAVGCGCIVRLASDVNNAEHFGALIDGEIYDFYGCHRSPDAWVRLFVRRESIADRVFRYVEGFAQNPDFPVPDDPAAEKAISGLLSQVLHGNTGNTETCNS